jgi:rhodanese-related sulfurtransferase
MKTLARAAALCLVSLAAGLTLNQKHQEGIPWNQLSSSLLAPSPWIRISPDSAYTLFSKRAAEFVDIRPEPEYTVEHVAGAVNLPVHSFFREFGMFERTYPKDRVYVFYCFEPSCREGRSMLRLMRRQGYKYALWMHGGLSYWMQNGYPVEGGRSAP